MARGIFGAINKVARAGERASREQARERSRLVKENERHARLEEQLGKQSYRELRIAETEKANAQLLNGWNSYARFYFAPSIATRA